MAERVAEAVLGCVFLLSYGVLQLPCSFLKASILKMKMDLKSKGIAMKDDVRREAALASAAPLQPTFKPLGVSHHQLSKFQELHRRRLLIKSKSKNYDNSKEKKKGNCPRKTPDTKSCTAANVCESSVDEECSAVSLNSDKMEENSSPPSDNGSVHMSKKQRLKLHWGLDTKERWEMKANM